MDLSGVWKRYEPSRGPEGGCPAELAGAGCPGSSSRTRAAAGVGCPLSRAAPPELPAQCSPALLAVRRPEEQQWAPGMGWRQRSVLSTELRLGRGWLQPGRSKKEQSSGSKAGMVVVQPCMARSAPAQCPGQGLRALRDCLKHKKIGGFGMMLVK